MLTRALNLCFIVWLVVGCNAAPTLLPLDQITAMFPQEVYQLRVRITKEQYELIQKTVDENPDDEQRQWSLIREKEPKLADIAQALWNFLRDKEERLSPPGRLLFDKLIDGIPIVKFGDPAEIKTYVYETLRLWYAMDLRSKQNFARVLPRNAAALSNPNIVHYALSENARSQ